MRARFTLRVCGVEKSLFSVREIPNADDKDQTDLNIHFRGVEHVRLGNSLEELIGECGADQYVPANIHFSVHATTKSLTANSVHRTICAQGNIISDTVMMTTALKVDNLFAPITSVICGDFDSEISNVPAEDDCERFCIGECDTKLNQFRFMVLVARSGNIFSDPSDPFLHHPSRVTQLNFEHYELIIISSYSNFVPSRHSIDLVPFTTRQTGPVRGLDWWEAFNLYDDIFERYFHGRTASSGAE